MRIAFSCSAVLVLFCLWSAAWGGGEPVPLKVVYPAPESSEDRRDADVVELLQLVLDKTVATHGPYRLQPSAPLNEKRYRESLRHNVNVSLAWLSVTAENEREFLAVRIPLRKGLLGYRVLIVRQQDQAKFARIRNVDQLKVLRMGQGTGWNDIPLLRANGFNVVVSQSYDNLFSLLANGRVDYLSRGINEAWREVESFRVQYPDLTVEPTLMLYYPWPKYFYLNRKQAALAQRLELGLRLAQQDGSFDRLFRRYHQPDILRAGLDKRRVFCIDNPLFPPQQAAEAQRWWFVPAENFPCPLPAAPVPALPDKKQ